VFEQLEDQKAEADKFLNEQKALGKHVNKETAHLNSIKNLILRFDKYLLLSTDLSWLQLWKI